MNIIYDPYNNYPLFSKNEEINNTNDIISQATTLTVVKCSRITIYDNFSIYHQHFDNSFSLSANKKILYNFFSRKGTTTHLNLKDLNLQTNLQFIVTAYNQSDSDEAVLIPLNASSKIILEYSPDSTNEIFLELSSDFKLVPHYNSNNMVVSGIQPPYLTVLNCLQVKIIDNCKINSWGGSLKYVCLDANRILLSQSTSYKNQTTIFNLKELNIQESLQFKVLSYFNHGENGDPDTDRWNKRAISNVILEYSATSTLEVTFTITKDFTIIQNYG